MNDKLSRDAVRRLGVDDLAKFETLRVAYALEMGGMKGGTPDPDFANRLLNSGNALIFGIADNGGIVGFLVLYKLPEAIGTTWCGLLDDLYVAPAYRRRGYARSLIDAAIEYAQKEGWSHVRWLVPESDISAIDLYRKLATAAPWRSFVKYL